MVQYDWIGAKPVQTDNTNYDWVMGSPYIIIGEETPGPTAADFLVRLNHWPHNFKNAM
jgi:hypothetical protein